MAKAVTEVAIGAAAIGASFLVPGGGIALGSLLLSHSAVAGALVSMGASSVMTGVADALKGNQGGVAVGVTSPIGPWGYIYGTQMVGGVEIFRESNNNTGVSGSTSDNKQLHRVYALACHPCAIGPNWQLRIDGKQVLVRQDSKAPTDYVSYSPTQVQSDITSISRTNGVVTMVLSSPMPEGTDGTTLQVRSVSDNTYNGTWVVEQPNPQDFTTWTYICGGSNGVANGGNVRTCYSDYKDKIRVSFLNGTHTATFPTLLKAGTSWSASDLCLGRTLAYVQMGYDDTVFPSSIPNVSFVIQGKNDIWDSRTGQRGFSTNPALCIADYLCMPTTKGGFGLNIETDIPTAGLTAAANICDETMLLNTGGTTAQYTMNTFFMLNESRGTILQNLLSSCAGRISYQGGTYNIVPGAWVAPSLQLNESDIIGPIDFRPRLGIRDTANAVKGTFVSPENNYQQGDIPPYMQDSDHGYTSDAYLAEDRGERIFREVNFPCTDSSAIAQRLAKIALLRTRFQGRLTIRCTLKAYQAVALDVVQLSLPHYGWVNKNFEVLSSRFGLDKSNDVPTPYVELDLAETDPSIYEWTPTEQLTPQDYVQPNNIGIRICMPPENVVAYSGTGGLLNGYQCPSTITRRTDGSESNSIYVAWTEPNDGAVMSGGHMECQYQLVGASTWSSMGKIDPSAGSVFIPSVTDGAQYNIQVRAVNSAGVPSDWIQATPYPVTVSATSGSGGGGMIIPQQVTNVSAVESPYKTAAGMVSLVAVDFQAPNDPNWAGVNIYFTGYNGSFNPQFMTASTTSPVQFLCQTTGETVTVTVVSTSISGSSADFNAAPTCLVTLDGVESAPPAPSISEPQTALTGGTGWEFSYNIIRGYFASTIAGYRVYHSESNDPSLLTTNNLFKTIPQPTTNIGTELVQETVEDILFYWVSSIDVFGNESALTPVPFVYVDPGNPAPTAPSPVQTTKVFSPSTSLNGWGPGAHVGWWETQNSDNGSNFGLSHSQTVLPFSNPSAAFDGNSSTTATFSESHTAQYGGCVWSFNNYPGLASGASVVSATLNITSSVVATSGPIHGEASIWYSVDNGNTWNQVYLASYQNGGNASRPTQTDSITLSASQNFSQLQVMACGHSHDDLAMNVYEINLSVVQSSAAGPEKVTGVKATLVNNDVQIAWNALTPTTRTDITNYEVTRVVHGGGYAQSKVQVTVTPTGVSSYTWTDLEAHDGSWDYYVVANNSTGASQPSDVARLTNAAQLIYATGATVESLKPAEGGAERTTGKSLDILSDGSTYKRVAASTGIQRFKVAAKGLSATIGEYGLWLNGAQIAGAGRSFNLAVYNRSNLQQVGIYTYDVFGDPSQASAMANWLNSLGTGYIVFIWTFDEPQSNRTAGGLPAALQRCGASTAFTSSAFQYRSAYLLVGIPGIGLGNGIEMYSGQVGSDPNAFCETSVTIIDGEIQGLNGTNNAAVNQDTIPDGSSFRRVSAIHVASGGTLQYSNGALIDSLQPLESGAERTTGKSLTVLTDRSLDYIGNGGSRMAVSQIDGNGRAVIDFSQGHYNKNLAYVGDVAGRYAAVEPNSNYTAGHVLTATAIPSASLTLAASQGITAIPSFGWSLQTQNGNDVYNISAVMELTGTTPNVTISVVLDGGTVLVSRQVFITSTGTTTIPFFYSTGGLGGGSHTLQLYIANNSGSAQVTVQQSFSYAMCQRIF